MFFLITAWNVWMMICARWWYRDDIYSFISWQFSIETTIDQLNRASVSVRKWIAQRTKGIAGPGCVLQNFNYKAKMSRQTPVKRSNNLVCFVFIYRKNVAIVCFAFEKRGIERMEHWNRMERKKPMLTAHCTRTAHILFFFMFLFYPSSLH